MTGFADLQETNSIDITCHFSGSPAKLEITFADRGIPYDPMKKKKPANGEADERSIFMLKESMDDIKYHCENGQNILTITKTLQPAE